MRGRNVTAWKKPRFSERSDNEGGNVLVGNIVAVEEVVVTHTATNEIDTQVAPDYSVSEHRTMVLTDGVLVVEQTVVEHAVTVRTDKSPWSRINPKICNVSGEAEIENDPVTDQEMLSEEELPLSEASTRAGGGELSTCIPPSMNSFGMPIHETPGGLSSWQTDDEAESDNDCPDRDGANERKSVKTEGGGKSECSDFSPVEEYPATPATDRNRLKTVKMEKECKSPVKTPKMEKGCKSPVKTPKEEENTEESNAL